MDAVCPGEEATTKSSVVVCDAHFKKKFPYFRGRIQSQKLIRLVLAAINCWKRSSCLLPNALVSADATTSWVWFCCLRLVLTVYKRLLLSTPWLRLQDFKVKAQAQKQSQMPLQCLYKHITMKILFPRYFPSGWGLQPAPRSVKICMHGSYINHVWQTVILLHDASVHVTRPFTINWSCLFDCSHSK